MKYLMRFALVLLLTACNFPQITASNTATSATLPTAAVATSEPIPTAEPTLSFEPAVYQDEGGRFEISYPSGWMVDASQGGSRGSYVQITSWQHPEGGITEVPADGTILQIAVYLWDPTGDLPARVEMRRNNFLASGNTILEESEFVFPGGESGVRMLLRDTNGDDTVVVFALLGDDYLELSGSGNVNLADEIIRTFRFSN